MVLIYKQYTENRYFYGRNGRVLNQLERSQSMFPKLIYLHLSVHKCNKLTLKVLVATIDAQWEGWGM